MIIHASAVEWHGLGVLVLGASGAGKSSLALRLIALGATLVADDRVLLRRQGDDLLAEAPHSLCGLVEARGVGILRLPHSASAAVILAVDLDRHPEGRMQEARKIALLGCEVSLISGRGIPNLDAIITLIAQNRAHLV